MYTHNIQVPDSDATVTIQVNGPNYQSIFFERQFSAYTSGMKGKVMDDRGSTICHCFSFTDAQTIADALNFWSRARLLNGAS